MSIRAQIFDALTSDATLVAMLPKGTKSVVNERDYVVGQTAVPCLIVHYVGPHPHQNIPELDLESWEIKCPDQGQAYYNIEAILERVRKVLHRKQLASNADGTSAGLEIMYGWRTRSRFDPEFREESQSVIFLVPVLHST